MTPHVLVLGSGGGGLAAALAAARAGAAVTMLERSGLIGGTTAVSGGGLWVPGARAVSRAGVTTSPEAALGYLATLAGDRGDLAMMRSYLERAPGVLDQIEAATPLRFQHAGYPDYHTGLPGSSESGHCVESGLLDGPALLGSRLAEVRDSPFYPAPFTLAEVSAHGGMAGFWGRVDAGELRRRRESGAVGMGRALAVGLYTGCLTARVQVRTGWRAVAPVIEQGAVRGVVTAAGERLSADAIVVATGGFEWDEGWQQRWLPGPVLAPASPPHNTGDGIRIGQLAGAAVANTQEAWWYPVVELPGEAWPEGWPLRRLTFGERTNPHSIAVNKRGQRFCNESSSYHVVGRMLTAPDPSGIGFANDPAWLIFDSWHRRRYRVQTLGPGDPDPAWLEPAPSLTALAEREGIDPPGLLATVQRFNQMAAAGRDDDFRRGASAYDRHTGDPTAPHPCLGPVEQPPFYALRLMAGTIGTKGGLLIDAGGRVLDASGAPIPGLFAGSNAVANLTGAGYPGAGGTLGPAIVTGWLAGQSAGCAAGPLN